ncbi:MAG: hypothetical protein ABR498_09690, partial [Candidatus Dormibacteria bacterium]
TQQCDTAWCAEHRNSVDRVTYCRRHAGLMRSLTPSVFSDLPALGNRAPSLVIWVGRLIDFDVRALLAVSSSDERVGVDRVVPEHRGGVCVWVMRWHSAMNGARDVTLEVSEVEDATVVLRADGRQLFAAQPACITARLQGNRLSEVHQRAARALFCSDLMNALEQHVHGSPLYLAG